MKFKINTYFNKIPISIIYKIFVVSIFLFPASHHLSSLIFGTHKIAKIQILSKSNISKELNEITYNYTYSLEYYDNNILKKHYFNSNTSFEHNQFVDVKIFKSKFVILNFAYIYLSSIKLTFSVILITMISAVYFSYLKS